MIAIAATFNALDGMNVNLPGDKFGGPILSLCRDDILNLSMQGQSAQTTNPLHNQSPLNLAFMGLMNSTLICSETFDPLGELFRGQFASLERE